VQNMAQTTHLPALFAAPMLLVHTTTCVLQPNGIPWWEHCVPKSSGCSITITQDHLHQIMVYFYKYVSFQNCRPLSVPPLLPPVLHMGLIILCMCVCVLDRHGVLITRLSKTV